MKHLIKIESTPHGVLGVRHAGLDQQYCEAGEQVILKWQPDAKWGLQEAHYTDGDDNVTPIDLTPVKVNGMDVVVFTMPDDNITVGGTFKRFVLEDWTGDAAESPIFNEHIDATDQQRNTALANVSNQTANSTTGKMGYKVLDPTKTFAEQVTAENTIYEIRDVFDFGGTQETPVSVTLPAGSTLKFNGGVIKNCTLVNAYIDAAREKIFDTSVNFTNLKNATVYPEWFGAKADGITDCYSAFMSCNQIGVSILLSSGTYRVETPLVLNDSVSIIGENKNKSMMLTNGVTLGRYSVVNNLSLKALSNTTSHLLKVTTENSQSGKFFKRIVIDGVNLFYNADGVADTAGLLFETKTASVNGFYGVNISNVFMFGAFKYGILFNALSDRSWMSFLNFNGVFIDSAIYPIEFESADTTDYANFQSITLKDVSAQYTSGVTLSFVRFSHCSRIGFDSCCCVDSPLSLKPYYFKDEYSTGIYINNEGEDSLPALFESASGFDYQSIISRYCSGIVQGQASSISSQEMLLPTASTGTKSSALTSTLTKCLIQPVYNVSKQFVGFKFTNNNQMFARRCETMIGVSDGHLVHTNEVEADTNFIFGDVYSTRYIPKASAGVPSMSFVKGAFFYRSDLRCMLYYDSTTQQWTDPLNVVITANVTQRRGTTTEREAMSMTSDNSGFLFYDTTLKKYVLWNGNSWVNLDGTALS